MNPVEYDGCSLLVVSGDLVSRETRIIAEGLGRYDGETFLIETPEREEFDLTPYLEGLVARPLTGIWKNKYPLCDFYVVIDQEGS